MHMAEEIRIDVAGHDRFDFERQGHGDFAVIYVPGFTEIARAWDSLIAEIPSPTFEIVRLDTAGTGRRANAAGPMTLERFADDLAEVIDRLDKPVTIIGHSMGTQIAELAALRRPDVVDRLVLVAPIPLGGSVDADGHALHLDPEELREGSIQRLSKFGSLGADLGVAARAISPKNVQAHFEAWANGNTAGRRPSDYSGPVLLVPGNNDPASPPAFVASNIAPRFPNATTTVINDAAHHPHLEQPRATAAVINAFARATPTT
jgi:pimeloyl-ACP methyl ester carboxylesterase